MNDSSPLLHHIQTRVATERADTQSTPRDVTRRAFVSSSSAAIVVALLAQACGGGSALTESNQPVAPPPTGSYTYSGGVLVLKLALLPDLTATNGHQVIGVSDGTRRADVVVINVGGAYKAFTSICTHEGCTVAGYTGVRLVCPCHGSEFDVNGNVVVGPAPSSLRQYTTTLDSTAQTLSLSV